MRGGGKEDGGEDSQRNAQTLRPTVSQCLPSRLKKRAPPTTCFP